MENKEDEKIESLIRKMMLNTAQESPSADFTKAVMAEVLTTNQNNSFNYKPILSRRIWVAIFTVTIMVFGLTFYQSDMVSGSFSLNFLINKPGKLENIFQNFRISTVTAYVISLATITILMQTFFLKKHFDKKFDT